MLLMIPLAVDEVIAMGQFMRASVRNGKPFWRTFWVGGTIEGGSEDKRTPQYGVSVSKMLGPMMWGVSIPWNLVIVAALGIWLMFAPSVFGTTGGAANSDHLLGAIITTVSVIATAEVVRAGRLVNMLLGAALVAAPWLFSGGSAPARWNDVIAGLAVIALTLPRGPVRERYAKWNRLIV